MPGIISQDIAQKIVNSHKSYLNHDITMMDTTGCIIACTNVARVGSIHGGAVKMFNENLDTLNIYYDSEYPGTLHGVNKMIYRFGKPVGVVGITGDVAEVEPFGEIIRSMTELLLAESDRLKEEDLRRQNIERFINQWLDKDNNTGDPLFIQQGQSLGINILLPRRVVIMSVVRRNREEINLLYDDNYVTALKQIIQSLLGHDYRNLWLFSGNRVVLMVNEDSNERLTELLFTLKEAIKSGTESEVYFGCDEVSTAGKETSYGYLRAMSAIAMSDTENWLSFYKNVNLDLVINSIQDDVKRDYVQSIFKNCSNADIIKWCEFLTVYAEKNGSINKIAEQLYLHKNSVQQRILALEKQTGYDCRKYRDFTLLYIASEIYKKK